MAEMLSEGEARLIDYLKALSRGGSRRVEVNISEAASSLSMSRDEVERLLVSLEEKGFLEIVKAPASRCFLDLIRRKLVPIDTAFLAGEMSPDEYTKRWEEVVSRIADPAARSRFPPLPPVELSEVINSLNNPLDYLERLSKEEVSQEIRGKLAREYNEEFQRSLNLLSRYLEAIESALEANRKLIESEAKEIRAIKVDERVREIDRSAEKRVREEKIRKAKQSIEKILMKIEGGSSLEMSEKLKEKISELESKLKELEEEYELTEARAIIESNVALRKRVEKLRSAIEDTRRSIEVLKSHLVQSQRKDARMKFQEILERARKLSQENLLWNENLQKLDELGARLSRVCTKKVT
ncbi:MAG: hypothetical protein QW407_05370 [Thermofilaceae archaeon]